MALRKGQLKASKLCLPGAHLLCHPPSWVHLHGRDLVLYWSPCFRMAGLFFAWSLGDILWWCWSIGALVLHSRTERSLNLQTYNPLVFCCVLTYSTARAVELQGSGYYSLTGFGIDEEMLSCSSVLACNPKFHSWGFFIRIDIPFAALACDHLSEQIHSFQCCAASLSCSTNSV